MLWDMVRRIALALVVLISACGTECPETAEEIGMKFQPFQCGGNYIECRYKFNRDRAECIGQARDCIESQFGERAACYREIGNESAAAFDECNLACANDFYSCEEIGGQFCGNKQSECMCACLRTSRFPVPANCS